MRALLFVSLCMVCVATAAADDAAFRPLFNGVDLSGWVPVNTAPSTWTVSDGMLVCSGKPTGELRTDRMYQNFILELEWRHLVPRGNAGVFVWADDITARGVPFHRSIEVQVLENAYGNTESHTTHGDIFPIHGTTMKPENGHGGMRAFPTEWRSNPSPEWNHYRIECIDGSVSLAVNGKVVTRGHECSLRKGYICLESEGGVVNYRNLRIQELPGEPLEDQYVAIADRGYRSLYTGVDLSGWQTESTAWQPADWVLRTTDEAGKDDVLISERSQAGGSLMFDLRRRESGAAVQVEFCGVTIELTAQDSEVGSKLSPQGQWDRLEMTVAAGHLSVAINDQLVIVNKPVTTAAGPIRLTPGGGVDLAGLYLRVGE
ncbi:MAG: DUF1080 domain-containing protein [Planctomycetaceae bacterium]|nr:DUF1080 domain-containing protein [Planctomycetaceae bacterium]